MRKIKIGKRRRARIYALQALYIQQTTGYSLEKSLITFWYMKRQEPEIKEDYEELIADDKLDDEMIDFTEQILRVTLKNLEEIDSFISKTASHWDFERIAMIDKSILRLAIGELLYMDGIPPKVTINEAIEIAKAFSSEKSGKFVNGVLDKIKTNQLDKKN